MTDTQKILELNAFDLNTTATLDAATAALVHRRQKTFGPTSMLFYQRPLSVVRGEGVWLYDADGRKYLDAYNNVPSVGHCHPRVVEAVSHQMATLNTNTRYLYDIVYTYAERLLATFPSELSNVVFTCTGSEGVDLALRMARIATGGTGIIATANAYHGNTAAVTAISPASASVEPPNPDVILVPAPDTYRYPDGDAEVRFVAAVAEAIAAMQARGIQPAAMIADSIFSSDGVYPGTPGFLGDAAALVRAAGGVVIADEVQPGFGRLGSHMWGFERHGFTPDLVVLGKPMGNGYPIGGVVARPDLLDKFGAGSGYFNTFGGSSAQAAAGLAVLDVLRDENLQHNAAETGLYLRAGLESLARHHAAIGDVRGSGLYLGLEFVVPDGSRTPDKALAVTVMNGLRVSGVLGSTAGQHSNIWKIRPPLCFNRNHADLLIDRLDGVMRDQGQSS